MAEYSPCDVDGQRQRNESTPPERATAHPPQRHRRRAPQLQDVTMDLTDAFSRKIGTTALSDTDGLNGLGAHVNSGASTEELSGSVNGKTESLCVERSLSSSGSVMDDSLNSSIDDRPDTSTPQHFIAPNSKYKMYRPPDLVIKEASDEENVELVDLDQCSPVLSPFPSSDTSNDSLFGHETPQPQQFTSPPKGTYLRDGEMRMIHLLKRFGLSHFAFIFIEQEVDVELFLTLNDEDLKEIGIKRNTDRNVILSVIAECNERISRCQKHSPS